jgi:hypothetical protein
MEPRRRTGCSADIAGSSEGESVNLRSGLEVEEPHAVVPWGISQTELQCLFGESGAGSQLRFVTDGYYVLHGRTIGGLNTSVGLQLRPRSEKGRLTELEFFDNGKKELQASFRLFQQHLEHALGPPSRTKAGSFSRDLPSYEWYLGRIRVYHWVMDRFGPEEHVRIVRKGWLSRWLRQDSRAAKGVPPNKRMKEATWQGRRDKRGRIPPG